MKKLLFTIAILSLITNKSKAADNYKKGDYLCVVSLNGLNIRSTCSLNSKIVSEIKFGSKVEVIDDTLSNVPLSIKLKFSPTNMTGFWVKIKSNNIEGYVFDGMLSQINYSKFGYNFSYKKILGIPKIDTIKGISEPINGIKYPYQIVNKSYNSFIQLEQKEEWFDACLTVTEIFKNISFNEAYWLILLNLYNDDGTDLKIENKEGIAVAERYTCS
nr:SH3 domain-containing protein [Pseudopedobacter sp.]